MTSTAESRDGDGGVIKTFCNGKNAVFFSVFFRKPQWGSSPTYEVVSNATKATYPLACSDLNVRCLPNRVVLPANCCRASGPKSIYWRISNMCDWILDGLLTLIYMKYITIINIIRACIGQADIRQRSSLLLFLDCVSRVSAGKANRIPCTRLPKSPSSKEVISSLKD